MVFRRRMLAFSSHLPSEGRFAKPFDADGNPSELLEQAELDRLKNWRQLQELAGVR